MGGGVCAEGWTRLRRSTAAPCILLPWGTQHAGGGGPASAIWKHHVSAEIYWQCSWRAGLVHCRVHALSDIPVQKAAWMHQMLLLLTVCLPLTQGAATTVYDVRWVLAEFGISRVALHIVVHHRLADGQVSGSVRLTPRGTS
jgi:hypothetical protein